jgi:protein involved in polysaccharide export with SLBB domain
MNGDTQVASLATLAPQARPLDYHNSVHLNPGDRVIVKRTGFEPEHGTVDNVSEDAPYFWAWMDGQSRILVFHGDGTVIHKVLS